MKYRFPNDSQVTIIEMEVWEKLMQKFGSTLLGSERRANLMVKGLDLSNSRVTILRIRGCRIKIFGETKPCERMDEVIEGLKEEMLMGWKGGAFGKVLDDGEIQVGNTVCWME